MQLPEAFLKNLAPVLGNEIEAFTQSLQAPAPVSIRINTEKAELPTNLDPVPWSNTGFYLSERPQFTLDPLLHAGTYYVQEASSMFLEQAIKTIMEKDTPQMVLDLCAAPGGKSTLLSNLLPDTAVIVSNEVIGSRANILAENIAKWGKGNVIVTNSDPAKFSELSACFDVIVVDAPCSGEGLFRKTPEAIDEWSESNVQLCSERQQRILSNAHKLLKPGGYIIYSTCTYNIHEDEENLQWLSEQDNFNTIRIKTNIDWGITEVNHNNLFGYRFFPHKTKGEGLFLAVLQKEGTLKPTHWGKIRKPLIEKASNKEKEQLSAWLKPNADFDIYKREHRFWLFSKAMFETVSHLIQHLHVVYSGVELAEAKHQDMIPAHGLALSKFIDTKYLSVIALNDSDILRYLSKEDIVIDSTHKGFCLITYKNIPLGWLKALGNRSNNLYPKEWRIRMSVEGKAAISIL